jgi:hypothetical protein
MIITFLLVFVKKREAGLPKKNGEASYFSRTMPCGLLSLN